MANNYIRAAILRFERCSTEYFAHRYIVTNSHVITEGTSTVVRVNRVDGGPAEPIETEPGKWIHHPEGDDLAAYHVGGFNPQIVKSKSIAMEHFITQELIATHDIGPGDDTFMVGRFSGHDGRIANLPSVRFGNISMMPIERVGHSRDYRVESFLVETRSLSGYSGSPVFVFLNPAIPRNNGTIMRFSPQLQFWLLGVDWGHIPIFESVKDGVTQKILEPKQIVDTNSGLMGVSPAWKLRELLKMAIFADARKDLEDRAQAHVRAGKPLHQFY